jgi:hypothetical protein
MWQRGGGAASCVVLIAFGFACGKTEHGDADQGGSVDRGGAMDHSAGSTAAGVPPTSGGVGAGGSSGASFGTAGAPVTVGGSTALGGASNAAGGAPADANPAGAPSDGGAPACSGYYDACGCGCCAATAPTRACVYPGLGQDLTTVAAEDAVTKQGGCAMAGCSVGREYFCCAVPAPAEDGGSYEASLIIGGINRIRFDKQTTACTSLVLAQTFPANPVAKDAFPVQVPMGYQLESVMSMGCTVSASGPRAIGAIGKFSLRILDEACVVDAHFTAFFVNDRQVNPVRFDADGVAIALPVSQCK